MLLAIRLLGAPDPPPATPAAPTPRQVWVVLDFYKEFGGTVVREDEATLVVRTPAGEERTVERSTVISAIPLLDDPPGTPVIVRYRDGRRVRAALVSDTLEGVTVEVKGMRTSMPRTEVWGLEREVPFETLLERYRRAVAPDAWTQRIALARWAMDQDHPEVALQELQEVVKHQDSEEVRTLIRLAQIAMEARKTRRPSPAGPGPSEPTRPEVPPAPRLQESDVNLIRVMEVDLSRPPRLEVAPELPAELVARHGPSGKLPPDGDTAEKLATWPATRVLTLLFQLKARDLYGRVRAAEDPWQLRLYRKQVHDAWIIPNCATSRCHGGDAAGAFRLVRDQSREARTAYTNLLHLLRFRTSSGESLVDFENPAASPLLDMGRPRESARRPHPAVPGWKPSVRDARGEPQASVEQWLKGMHRPRPEYPVAVEPPAAAAGSTSAGEER